jgi:uncharacterized caspase-like protein
MQRLALCLGLTRVDPAAYDGWDGECPGCDRDAARVATLAHDRGFDGVEVLINQAADPAYVKPAFLAAANQLESGDLLLLYCSGHGGQQPDVDGDEDDRRDETLCWWSGEVVDDDIAVYLAKLRPGVRCLFITDTCNSGSNYRGRAIERSTPVEITRTPQGMAASLLHLGGCADGRSSYGSEQGGVFTLALLDVLARARRPISYREWFERAARRMPARQAPVMSTWGGAGFEQEEALT